MSELRMETWTMPTAEVGPENPLLPLRAEREQHEIEETPIEIQAGLARTQMEHLPMPAGAEWTWLEAYGLMEAALEVLLPSGTLDDELSRRTAFVDRPPEELLQCGSGWGALERLRRTSRLSVPQGWPLATHRLRWAISTGWSVSLPLRWRSMTCARESAPYPICGWRFTSAG